MSKRGRSERTRMPAPMPWKVAMTVAGIATALCCAMKLWADVTVFADDESWLTFGLLVAAPAAVWFLLAIVAARRFSSWWRLGSLVPVLIAVTLVLAAFSVPGRIGWLTARSDMDRAAAECDTQQSGRAGSPHVPASIGVYKFHHLESGSSGTCEFYFSKNYPGVRSGFLYLPNGEIPVDDVDHDYVDLGASWYYFRA